MVVDDALSAEALHKVGVLGTRSRDHARSNGVGQLDGKHADSTAAAQNEHLLALLELRVLHQSLVAGEANERDARSLVEGQVLGLQSH